MKMFFGGLLLATGGLIALLSGLCSAYFFLMFAGTDGGLSMLPLVFMIGGIPFAIGLGLFFWGRSLIRSAREEERER
jgi:hypothetical protein